MENIDFLNKKTKEMKTVVSPDLQEKIDYILGKQEGYITYPAIRARLEKQSPDIQKEILESETFNKYCLDYVLGKTQKESVSFLGSVNRLNQMEPVTKKSLLQNGELKEFVLNYVLGKKQDHQLSLSAVKKRMELIPEELRAEIAENPELRSAYPEIV